MGEKEGKIVWDDIGTLGDNLLMLMIILYKHQN